MTAPSGSAAKPPGEVLDGVTEGPRSGLEEHSTSGPTARPRLRLGARQVAGPSLDRYAPAERSLPALLRDQAAALSGATWLVFDGEHRLTFGGAYEAASGLARRLRHDCGERPRVGIALRNRAEFVLALHGTLLAGGVAYLIDPGLPPRGLRRLTGGLGLDALVVEAGGGGSGGRSGDGEAGAPLVVTAGRATAWRRWLSGPVSGPQPALPPSRWDDDAIVMFTSGSTGKPKAVVLSHHFAFLYSALITDSLSRDAREVLTTALPLFHSSGLHMVAHSALHAGATAHLKRRFSASGFFVEAARDGATQAALVPEMARMILRRATGVPAHRLAYVLAGGLSDHAEFERRFGVPALWQAYGMTEAYPVPMSRSPVTADRRGLGMPVELYEYGVVGPDGAALPPGRAGELVLRPTAPQVMFSGYLTGPGGRRITPFGPDGVFHTGDIVSCDAAGVLRYVGRFEGGIRHRGERVDPAEVEAAALSCPEVTDAAAYGVPSDLGDEDVKLDVVGVVGVAGAEPIDLAGLHLRLRETLRAASLPRYLEQRATLPRTASYRVRRHELRADGVRRPGVIDTEAP
jgi:crotonobetaine/carnitine-CoA ligase